jgi:putative oxidoreductase
MNIPALLYPNPARTGSVALLIVRVVSGLLVAPHGYGKVTGGATFLAAGLAQKGFPAPTLLAWCAALAEFLGGLFLALGLLTRPAAAALSFTMVVAWSSMHMSDIGKVGTGGGGVFEYPFLLSLVTLAVAIAGGGRYSLDAMIFGPKTAYGPEGKQV